MANEDEEHVVAILKCIPGNESAVPLYVVVELLLTANERDCKFHHSPSSEDLSPMPLDYARRACQEIADQKGLRCVGYSPSHDNLAPLLPK